MKRILFLNLICIVSLFAMDFSFLKVEKITLADGKEYNKKNYIQANGEGDIKYKYIVIPPLEYNKKTGKFEFYKNDIEKGFNIGLSSKYKGNIKNGKREGYGIFTLNSIAELKYDGNWKNDTFHGEGILTQERSGFRYEGHFINGIKEGKGELSSYYPIYLNKDQTKYSLQYDKVNYPNRSSYKIQYIGNFKNDIIVGKAECNLVDIQYNSKQKCTFKNGNLQSKIKLPNELVNELKKSKKREVFNIRIADKTLKAISTIYTDKVYVVAETNMKDGEKVKIKFFIVGEKNKVLVKVLRTTLVEKFQILEEFNIPKILKEKKINQDNPRSLSAELEWDDSSIL